MSVQFSTLMLEGDYAFGINAAYTVCGWFHPDNITSTMVIWGGGNGGTGGNEDRILMNSDGTLTTETTISAIIGGQASYTTPITVAWYFIAIRRTSSSVVNLFLNDSVVATGGSYDVSGRTAADRYSYGRSIDIGSYVAGRMSQWRMWNVALTDAELRTERDNTTIQKSASGWASYAMATGATDYVDSFDSKTLFENVGAGTTGADEPTQPWSGGGLVNGGTLKEYTGSIWADRNIAVWNGSNWQRYEGLKLWDGSQWKIINTTGI
jgi:hypothetical protein